MKQTIALLVLLSGFISPIKSMTRDSNDEKHKHVLALIARVSWDREDVRHQNALWPSGNMAEVPQVSNLVAVQLEKKLTRPDIFLYDQRLVDQLLQDATIENNEAFTRIFEQSIAPDGIKNIFVDTRTASIEVIARERSNILVQILKRGQVPKLVYEILKNENDLRIKDNRVYSQDSSIHYRLILPLVNFKLVLRSKAGKITGKNLKGLLLASSTTNNVEIDGFNGSCEVTFEQFANVKNIRGNIFLKGYGSVHAQNIHAELRARICGNMYMNTISGYSNVSSLFGEIECVRVQEKSKLKTNKGRIILYDASGEISAVSQEGDIDVRLLPSAFFKLLVKTKSGSIAVCSQKLDCQLLVDKGTGKFSCATLKKSEIPDDATELKVNLGNGDNKIITAISQSGTISIEEIP